MSNFDSYQHPRRTDGKWIVKSAGLPAASLASQCSGAVIGTFRAPIPVTLQGLETHREEARTALREVVSAECDHVDGLVRDMLAPGPGRMRTKVDFNGSRLVIDEVWEAGSGTVIADHPSTDSRH